MRRRELTQESHSFSLLLCPTTYSLYSREVVPPCVSCRMEKQSPESPTLVGQAIVNGGCVREDHQKNRKYQGYICHQDKRSSAHELWTRSRTCLFGIRAQLDRTCYHNLLKRKTSLHSCPPVRAYCSITISGSGLCPCMI